MSRNWIDHAFGLLLDARRLASLLRPYGARSCTLRIDTWTGKGYKAEDLHDAWIRYLPDPEKASQASQASQASRNEPRQTETDGQDVTDSVPDVAGVTFNVTVGALHGNRASPGTNGVNVTDVTDVTDNRKGAHNHVSVGDVVICSDGTRRGVIRVSHGMPEVKGNGESAARWFSVGELSVEDSETPEAAELPF